MFFWLLTPVLLPAVYLLWTAFALASGRRSVRAVLQSPLQPAELWQAFKDCEHHQRQQFTKLDRRGTDYDIFRPRDGGHEVEVHSHVISVPDDFFYQEWSRVGSPDAISKRPWSWETIRIEETQNGSRMVFAAGGRSQFPFALYRVTLYLLLLRRLCRKGWRMPRKKRAADSRADSNTGDVLARTTLADEDRVKLAPGSHGHSRVKSRGAAGMPRDHSKEILLSILAFASFTWWLGWEGALLFAPMVLLHEYGHLLGFQLTGKTGNRMMLLPFFGGVAVAGESHRNEFENAFCALMGPAICLPLSVLLTAAAFYFDNSEITVGGYYLWWWCAYGAIICAFGNAINLAPVMPLDGGLVMQSLARSLSPSQAQPAMLVLTAAGAIIMYQAGYEMIAGFALLCGMPALLGNQGCHALPPLTARSGSIMLLAYFATAGIHLACAWVIYNGFY